MCTLRFHLMLANNGRTEFRQLYVECKLPADSIERLQRFTTIFQKMSDDFQWHYNFKENMAQCMMAKSRPRLLHTVNLIFQCLDLFCQDPYEPAVMKVYTFIYDRYRGFIKKFIRDLNSPFYLAKSSLLSFILTLTACNNEQVSNYLTINFQVDSLMKVMVQCFRLFTGLFHELDHSTNETDYEIPSRYVQIDEAVIRKCFQQHGSHPLVECFLKIYVIIQRLAKKNYLFSLFCRQKNNDIAMGDELREQYDGQSEAEGYRLQEMVAYSTARQVFQGKVVYMTVKQHILDLAKGDFQAKDNLQIAKDTKIG